jgi:hypothetical protein
MKIYGFAHRLTHKQKHYGPTLWQDTVQTCQDNLSFLDRIFLFPKVKTAFKGKRFQDDEDIKKKVMAELNAIPLEAFADTFHTF